jgi:hypothetical protein
MAMGCDSESLSGNASVLCISYVKSSSRHLIQDRTIDLI